MFFAIYVVFMDVCLVTATAAAAGQLLLHWQVTVWLGKRICKFCAKGLSIPIIFSLYDILQKQKESHAQVLQKSLYI